MSHFDPNLIEFVTAIIGSIAALAAAVGATIQLRLVRLEQRKRQQQEIPESADRPKQPTDGKLPQ